MYIYVHVLFLCTPQRLLLPSSWMHIYIFTFIDLYVHIYTVVVFGTTRQACFSMNICTRIHLCICFHICICICTYTSLRIFLASLERLLICRCILMLNICIFVCVSMLKIYTNIYAYICMKECVNICIYVYT